MSAQDTDFIFAPGDLTVAAHATARSLPKTAGKWPGIFLPEENCAIFMRMETNTRSNWSFWERSSLLGRPDLVVIGSGIVGLTAAIRLRERFPDRRVVVLERGSLPSGASTRNAGFACFGSMTELLADLEARPEEEVWQLVGRRWQGLQRLRALLGDDRIDYRELGGYEIFRAGEEESWNACLDNLDHCNRQLREIVGRPAVFREANDRLPSLGLAQVKGLLWNQAEGQLDPGKMMRHLLALARERGVETWFGLEVVEWSESEREVALQLAGGLRIETDRVLVATNGFARRLLPDLPVVPARNQVLITRPVAGLPLEGCFHYDRGYFYFRNVADRVLLGGGRHLAPQTEQTDAFGTTETIRAALLKLLHEVILPGKKAEVEQWWSGILGVGPAKTPIVQSWSPRIALAVRLGGMGVAIGSLVGAEGADLLAEC